MTMDKRDIEFFMNNLCYVVQRELDLIENTDLNFTSLAKDGFLGSGMSSKRPKGNQVEHLVKINLDLYLLFSSPNCEITGP